jgi:DNA-binding FadR family transcriptional regulator
MLIADRITDDFARDGALAGDVVGSEERLLERYGVGRGTLREAIRILEFRGVGCMRRGPNGGLVVTLPSAQLVGQSFAGHSLLCGVRPEHLHEALRVLDDIARQCPTSAIVRMFAQCLAILGEHFSLGHFVPRPSIAFDKRRMTVGRRRAGQTARNIITDLTRTPGRAGSRFGAEADLCRRYGVSRSVARQTVRLLEDAGVIESRRGRGRGLFVRQPTSDHVIRVMCLHLQTEGVTAAMSWQVGQLLSIALAGTSAEHAARCSAEVAQSSAMTLQRRAERDRGLSLDELFAIDQSIDSLAANPLLALMLDSLKSYSALVTSGRDMMLARFAANCSREYLEYTAAVLAAIARGDAHAAARAQELKNQFFESRVRAERVAALV